MSMMLSAQQFAVLDKVDLSKPKQEKIQKLVSALGQNSVDFRKQQVIKSMLENSEKWLTLRKTMDAGLQSADIEIFSNVLSVVIPKL